MFKKRILILLVISMVILAFTGGCAPKTESPAPATEQPSTTTETPDPNADKELVIAVRQANNTFDPSAPANAYDTIGRNQIYDTLIRKSSTGEIIPSLAESFEVATDAMSITFKLNKGVLFHNGDEFKASDAKFSIERAMTSKPTANYFSSVEKVEIVDDYTIKVVLKDPNVALLEVMITYGQMVNKSVVESFGDKYGTSIEATVGTGPYVLKEWTPNELAVFESNPNYFEGEAAIKKLRFIAITDVNAAMIALQTGEVGLYLDTVPAIHVAAIESNEDLELTPITSKRLFYLFFNNEKGPFTDIRLRQAVNLAIDREKLLAIGSEGLATPVKYVGAPDYTGNPNIDFDEPRDIEKAKQLVKEAGMEGATIRLMLEHSAPMPALATAIQEDMKQIGLNVTINSMEVNTFLSDVWAGGNYDMTISFTTARTKDMDTVWSTLFLSKNIGAGNSARYTNLEMDTLLAKARGEVDPVKREGLYAEAIEIFREDIPLLALYYEYSNRVYSKDLLVDKGLVEYDMVYYYSWK